jgi:hypothetical protein
VTEVGPGGHRSRPRQGSHRRWKAHARENQQPASPAGSSSTWLERTLGTHKIQMAFGDRCSIIHYDWMCPVTLPSKTPPNMPSPLTLPISLATEKTPYQAGIFQRFAVPPQRSKQLLSGHHTSTFRPLRHDLASISPLSGPPPFYPSFAATPPRGTTWSIGTEQHSSRVTALRW